MKLKIRINDKISGKVIIKEKEIPDKEHLAAQIKYRAHVFKPKKGKGSFKRTKKIEESE